MKGLNRWYDGLPEPRRFALFFGFVAAPISLAVAYYPPAALAIAFVFATARLWPWR